MSGDASRSLHPLHGLIRFGGVHPDVCTATTTPAVRATGAATGETLLFALTLIKGHAAGYVERALYLNSLF